MVFGVHVDYGIHDWKLCSQFFRSSLVEFVEPAGIDCLEEPLHAVHSDSGILWAVANGSGGFRCVEESCHQANPVGDFFRIRCPGVVTDFECLMAEVGLNIELAVAAGVESSHVVHVLTLVNLAEEFRALHSVIIGIDDVVIEVRAAVSVVAAPAGKWLERIENVLEFEPHLEDVLDGFEAHLAGVEMDMKSAASIDLCACGLQCGCGFLKFLNTGFSFEDGRHQFVSAGAIAHDFPVGCCAVGVSLIFGLNACGAETCENLFYGYGGEEFNLNSEAAGHCWRCHG